MVHFKTTMTKQVPFGREIKNEIVHIMVSKVQEDANNVVTYGEYYFVDANGVNQHLSWFKPAPRPWEQLELIEATLPTFNNSSIKAALEQRTKEFTLAVITLEAEAQTGANYGIVASDLVVVND